MHHNINWHRGLEGNPFQAPVKEEYFLSIVSIELYAVVGNKNHVDGCQAIIQWPICRCLLGRAGNRCRVCAPRSFISMWDVNLQPPKNELNMAVNFLVFTGSWLTLLPAGSTYWTTYPLHLYISIPHFCVISIILIILLNNLPFDMLINNKLRKPVWNYTMQEIYTLVHWLQITTDCLEMVANDRIGSTIKRQTRLL